MDSKVALIQMPFASVAWPSLGLSLLKSALVNRGIPTHIYYLNLWYAEMVDTKAYWDVVRGVPATYDLVGEWIFSEAVWGEDSKRDQAYIDRVIHSQSPDHGADRRGRAYGNLDLIVQCRQQVNAFLDRCLTEIDWSQYRVVGFTSVFQQHLACLALAKRLKHQFPHLFIVFGGANCEGTMGQATFRNFDFIDAVCSGEGDFVFPELVERVLQGSPIGFIPGIKHRQDHILPPSDLLELTNGEVATAPVVHDLDALPYPDYTDFFTQLSQVQITDAPKPKIMFETSRGCWWGQKSHCTFCGLNGSTIAFRQKSAERSIKELQWLLERYGQHTSSLSAVDNIIPYEYFQSFLPMLKSLNLDLDLFYETKSNLRKDQIRLYREVGLRQIQPGIESLSTTVLKLMRKGVTGIQNIQMLKWCRQFAVEPLWNYLIGFPGEQPEDYEDLPDVIESITHLAPPLSMGRVRFDRFSPYLTQSEELGVRKLKPYEAYRYIYAGFSDEDLHDAAYYFVGEFDGQERVTEYTQPLVESLMHWIQHGAEYTLFSVTLGDKVLICDLRRSAKTTFHVLSGKEQAIFEACDSIITRQSLQKRLQERFGHEYAAEIVDELLTSLMDRRLILEERGSLLALPVPIGDYYSPPPGAMQRLNDLLQSLRSQGSSTDRGVLVSTEKPLVQI